ncbi:CoA pyrophosphatase [Roseibium aquae]|nr:CoA pyrophosphatase [Roseibium aquae]
MPEPLPSTRPEGAATLDAIRACFAGGDARHLARETGDHILNPGMGVYARWQEKPRDAAVLIGIHGTPDNPLVLLTQRTATLSSHAGQIAFPGGRIDPDDEDAAHAALREANEEVGLLADQVDLIGSLPPYLTGSGYRVIPVVGRIEGTPRLVPNPHEVADLFDVPLSFLMNPANHQKHSKTWQGQRRYFYAMPFQQRYIWGVTAGIIRSLYETVFPQ